MKKTVFCCLICVICFALVACVSVEQSYESEHLPEYLIKAKSDNGFVTAYQAYFAVDGDSVSEISAREYERLTLGDSSKYQIISEKTYSFDIIANGGALSEWQYEQNKYDSEIYSLPLLIKDLSQMNLPYTGKLYVLIKQFDDYRIISVANLDGCTLLDESYAVFRNNRQLPLPKNIRLDNLWRFYKLR